MTENRLVELFNRYLNRLTTDAENKELWEAWNDDTPALNPTKERLIEEAFDSLPITYSPTPLQSTNMFARVMDEVNENRNEDVVNEQITKGPGARILVFRQRWWIAAAVILLLCVGGYLWLTTEKHKQSPVNIAKTTEIIPGKDGATLTLADGSQVLLDTLKNATIGLQGGVTAKVVNGALFYEGVGNTVVYNTMSTPRGRQFQIILPDGSKVWLNAASSIRFPTVFTGAERKVEISGEVYFEVFRNEKMPFRVNVGNRGAIEVLGTGFNVNAYSNEPLIKTTLLHGSVRVQGGNSGNVILKPGQQAQIANDVMEQQLKVVSDVETDKVVAWKNGLFDFEDVSFDVAMRQLERWFDITVVYENNKVPDIEFIGKMTRDVSFNGLLKGLRRMGVQYRVEGRTLIVLSGSSQ